jgi:hypothetical protein
LDQTLKPELISAKPQFFGVDESYDNPMGELRAEECQDTSHICQTEKEVLKKDKNHPSHQWVINEIWHGSPIIAAR